MRVMVTGGTGFLGSHIVSQLTAAGHEVRLLARTPAKCERALRPFGSPDVELIRGNVLDGERVDEALEGCDAVVHAANMFSYDPRHRQDMLDINVRSTEQVLGRAVARGCNPILHVSSVVTLFPAHEVIAADPPLGRNPNPYGASKLAADRVARRLQDEGRPVVITYPGAVFGPHDPGPGEMVALLHGFLGQRHSLWLPRRAGVTIADVRWLARAHAALLEPTRRPRRVNMGGQYATWNDLFRVLRKVTGRRLPQRIPSLKSTSLLFGRLANLAQWFVPVRLPFSYENAWLLFNGAATDDRAVERLVGPPPPLHVTLGDAIRWAVEAGHLPPEWVGALRSAPSESPAEPDEAELRVPRDASAS